MYDSIESAQGHDRTAKAEAGRWLLLIHHIPPKPDYFRVKVRRQLQRIGAVALKNSVYVLPRTDEAIEDFHWLRRMVETEGGEATVCVATFVAGMSDREVEAMFRAQSDAEYREIIAAARSAAGKPAEADVRRLMRHLHDAAARDFFHADRAAEAERLVRESEKALHERRPAGAASWHSGRATAPSGATWVTRSQVFVDRIASAWLIRRFIDDGARFKFVAAEGYRPEPGEFRFDMFDGEFTHEGESCTFEVLVSRFVPHDVALQAIAEIVHAIDCKDEKFSREEAVGVERVIRGLAAAHHDDAARVEAGALLFDGLYAAFLHPAP